MTGNFRNFSFPHISSDIGSNRGMWEDEYRTVGTRSYIKNGILYERVETPTIYDYEAIPNYTPRNLIGNMSDEDRERVTEEVLGIKYSDLKSEEKYKMDMELKTIVDKKVLELVYDNLNISSKHYESLDDRLCVNIETKNTNEYLIFESASFERNLADLLVGLKVLDEDLYNEYIKEKAIKNYEVDNDEGN